MNLQNKKSHKKIVIVTVIMVTTLAVSAFAYAYISKNSLFGQKDQKITKVNDIDYDKPSKEQQAAGGDIETSNSSPDPNQVGSDRAPQPTRNGSAKANAPITITASGQNGNTVQIRTLISALTNTGTCTITLTNQSKSTTKSSSVQSLPSSSTCKGFDIPTSDLSIGTWQYTLVFENETMKGSTTGSVAVQQVTQ